MHNNRHSTPNDIHITISIKFRIIQSMFRLIIAVSFVCIHTEDHTEHMSHWIWFFRFSVGGPVPQKSNIFSIARFPKWWPLFCSSFQRQLVPMQNQFSAPSHRNLWLLGRSDNLNFEVLFAIFWVHLLELLQIRPLAALQLL